MARRVYEGKKFRDASLITIARANDVLEEYAAMGFDLTLRQLFYQFVSKGWIANSQQEYNKLGNVVNDARLAGRIDWDSIVDRTRFERSLSHWGSPAAIIKGAGDSYQRDLWLGQETRPVVWIEKDALVGVIEGVCETNDVPYLSCRGYVSQSEMWGSAQRILKMIGGGQSIVLLHLGDHDPSGIDMTRDIEARLLKFLAIDHWRDKMEGSSEDIVDSFHYVEANFEVKRLALHMRQVEEHEAPPNPAKLTDSRANSYIEEYGYESWELDALPPNYIADLIQDAIDEVKDHGLFEQQVDRQESERELLVQCSDEWADVVGFLEGGERA